MKNSITAAAVAAFAVIGGAAVAAPMTVTDTLWFTGGAGQLGNGASLGFGTAPAPTVTASAHKLNSNLTIGSDLALGQWSGGLGACSDLGSYRGSLYCKEDHQVDGDGQDEVIKLLFSEAVTIEKVYFSFADDAGRRTDNEYFTFSFISGVDSKFFSDVDPVNGVYSFAQDWTGTTFGFGADDRKSEWKLKGVEFSYTRDDGQDNGEPEPVPLPASGLLLIAGLGAVAGMKRRRKA